MTKSLLICLLTSTSALAQWHYPDTKTVDATDTYFGTTYEDPYRWLEDLKSKDVEAWFKAQADLTDGLLTKIPGRDALVDEWMKLDKLKPASYSSINCENVGTLYFREGWTGTEKLLFDPGTYKTGVVMTVESIVPSWDGKHIAIGL